PPHLAAPSGWAGLGLVAVACLVLDGSTPYPGVAALLPVLGTALVVGAGCSDPRRGVGSGLAHPVLRAIGRLSYCWYLWHWPVLLLLPSLIGRPLSLEARLSAAILSAGPAIITLVLVEDPARFARPFRDSVRSSLLLGGAVTAAGLAASLVLLIVVPAPVGHGGAAAETRLDPVSAPAAPTESPQDAAVRGLTAQVQSAVAASVGLHAVPSNLTPPLGNATTSKEAPFLDGCVLAWTATNRRDCTYGDPAGTTRVALFGDSHAGQWQAALETAAEQQHWQVDVFSKVTCPPLDVPISSPYLHREYTECERWRSGVVDRLRADPPALVVLAMVRRYGSDFGSASYDPQWTAGLGRTVSTLRATGAPVLVLGPVPDPHGTVPACLSAHLADAGACTPPRQLAVNDAGIAAQRAATEAAGGTYADLTDLFCTQVECPLVVGNTLVFRDDNHLTVEYAAVLGPVVSALIARALPGG
ncbi:MAG TPA: acyltransferase family protein, partial [Blastococcus sp.]